MQFESSHSHQQQHHHHHHPHHQSQHQQSSHLSQPTNNNASSSSNSSSSPASSLMPTSPAGSSIASLVEEHVVALHDFSSNNSTCLSFQQGQVIKVFTRDDSGWWDGEIDGNRGWFPSNYVDESGMSVGFNSQAVAASQASDPSLPIIQTETEEDEGDDGNHHNHYGNENHDSSRKDRYLSYVTAPSGVEASGSNNHGGYRQSTTSSSSNRNQNYHSDSNPQSPNLSSSSSGVIDPIVHAIALLHNAARAHRVAHFQPSTSCVISSVRSVLSATDCLTRESPVLQAHPILGRERKAILSELSRLVNQSRKASSTNLNLENNEFERETEMKNMLIMADQVLKNVKRFLNVAVECGVDVPNRRSSVYDDLISSGGERRPSGAGSVGSSTAHNHYLPDRNEEDKTPTPDSPKSAYTYVTAKSGIPSPSINTKFHIGKSRASSYYSGHHQSDEEDGDVDNNENRKSGPFLLPTNNHQYSNRSASKSKQKEEIPNEEISNDGKRIRSGSTSEDPMESAGESNDSNSRSGSGSGSGSSDSVNEPINSPASGIGGGKLKTPTEVISRARSSEQELISIVAAFIGHAHTHTRGSPASSYAQLIERTRETVDGVRNLLSVIEAVHNNEKLQLSNPQDMKTLWDAREGLYEATSALVTAARLITSSSSSSSTSSSILSSPNLASFGEDEEKARLLAAATNVYRTGQECASVVDFCLKRISKDDEVLIALEDRAPSPNNNSNTASSSRENQRRNHSEYRSQNDLEGEDYDEDEELGSNGQSLKRGKHTLSFLGRKATSLNCLRERYETHQISSSTANGFEKVDENDNSRSSFERDGDDDDDRRGENSEGDEDGDVSRDGRSSTDSYRRIDSTPTPNGISASGSKTSSSSSTAISSRDSFDSNQHTARIVEPSLISERRGVSTPKPLMGRLRASTTAGLTNRPQLPGRKPPPTPLDSSINGGEISDGVSESVISRDDSRISGASTNTISSIRSSTTNDTSTRPSMEHSDSDPFPRSDSNNSLSTALLNRRQLSEQSSGSSPTASSVSSFQGQGNRFRSGTLDDRSLPSIPSSENKFLSTEFHPEEVSYNSEGQVTGATLEVLIEKMSPHGSTPDNTFSRTFFLCFRLFTTPLILFELLVSRYNLQIPNEEEMSEEDIKAWKEKKLMPIRVRTLNVFKTWLEVHWNPSTDHLILDKLIEFLNKDCFNSSKNPDDPLPLTALERQGRRLAELAQKRIISGPLKNNLSNATNTSGFHSVRPMNGLQRTVSTDRLKSTLTNSSILDGSNGSSKSNPSSPIGPQPIISKGLSSLLKLFPNPSTLSNNPPASNSLPNVNVTDFDPLELARQLTLMENREFCKIAPEELLGQEFSKKANVSNAIHVKKMSSLSTNITGWISECILGEPDARRRTGLVKFFVKLGDRCASLNNFNTLMAIQCALNSSTISRLKKTWDGLPQKYRIMMDNQRRSVEHTRNFAGYRNKLRETLPPALPFLGLFLTDLTFCHEGNASTRPSPLNPKKKLLNFDKYVKMSRIIGELQRFQLPYNLIEVTEIQNYLNYVLENVGDSNNSNGGMGVAEDLYRKSLLLEPRNSEFSNTNSSNTGTIGRIKGDGDSKLAGLDFFNWK